MKNFFKIIFLSSVVVFLAAGCNQNRPVIVDSQQSLVQRQQIQVAQKVEGVDSAQQKINFYADEGKNALDFLRINHTIETKTFSGIGEYVTSIDGVTENSGKNFWALYVNGQQSQVGASDYKPKNGDKIEWKLEEIKSFEK